MTNTNTTDTDTIDLIDPIVSIGTIDMLINNNEMLTESNISNSNSTIDSNTIDIDIDIDSTDPTIPIDSAAPTNSATPIASIEMHDIGIGRSSEFERRNNIAPTTTSGNNTNPNEMNHPSVANNNSDKKGTTDTNNVKQQKILSSSWLEDEVRSIVGETSEMFVPNPSREEVITDGH